MLREVAATLSAARCDRHVSLPQRSMSLQVLQALLEPHPIWVATRVLDFSIKVHGHLAAGNLIRTRNMIGQATISSLEKYLPGLGGGQGHVRQLLLLHSILVL